MLNDKKSGINATGNRFLSYIILFVVLAAFLLTGARSAKAVVSTTVDWGEGVIITVAMSDPLAQNGRTVGQKIVLARVSAMAMAESYLLGVIQGINIDRNTTIKDAIVAGDLIEKRIEGKIKGAILMEEGINELDLYEVKMAVKLADVARVVSEADKGTDRASSALTHGEPRIPSFHRGHTLNRKYLGMPADEKPVTESSSYFRREPEPTYPAEEKRTSSEQPGHSSLVVDGREIDGLIRDRAPIIYSDDGQVLFKGWEIPYYSDVDDAVQDGRTGSTPLMVNATGLKTNSDCSSSPHVTVTREDAEKIKDANNERQFLEDGNVLFVIGR